MMKPLSVSLVGFLHHFTARFSEAGRLLLNDSYGNMS